MIVIANGSHLLNMLYVGRMPLSFRITKDVLGYFIQGFTTTNQQIKVLPRYGQHPVIYESGFTLVFETESGDETSNRLRIVTLDVSENAVLFHVSISQFLLISKANHRRYKHWDSLA